MASCLLSSKTNFVENLCVPKKLENNAKCFHNANIRIQTSLVVDKRKQFSFHSAGYIDCNLSVISSDENPIIKLFNQQHMPSTEDSILNVYLFYINYNSTISLESFRQLLRKITDNFATISEEDRVIKENPLESNYRPLFINYTSDDIHNLMIPQSNMVVNDDEINSLSSTPINELSSINGTSIAVYRNESDKAKPLFNDYDTSITNNELLLIPNNKREQDLNIFVTNNNNSNFTNTKLGKKSNILVPECESLNINCVNGNKIEFTNQENLFCTASGESITVNRDSLDKARHFFVNCDTTVTVDKSLLNFKHAHKDDLNAPAIDSDNSDVDKIFELNVLPAEYESLSTNDCIDRSKIEFETPPNVFCTASGRSITVNKNSLDKAKHLFVNCDTNITDNKSLLLPKDMTEDDLNMCVIDSDNSIFVNEKKALVTNCGLLNANENGSNIKFKTPLNTFCTAGGRNIRVKEESLERAKLLFISCDSANKDEESTLISKNTTEHDLTSNGSKNKKMDEKSNLLPPTCKLYNDDSANRNKIQFKKHSSVFSTASGKKIYVNEDSLNTAKRLFINSDTDFIDDTQERASNRFVTKSDGGLVTKNPVKHTNILLSECKTYNTNQSSVEYEKPFNIFCTASGRNIRVKEQSLERAKLLFVNCDSSNKEDESVSISKNTTEHNFNRRLTSNSCGTKEAEEKGTYESYNVNVSDVNDTFNVIKTEFKKPSIIFSTDNGKNDSIMEDSERTKELSVNDDITILKDESLLIPRHEYTINAIVTNNSRENSANKKLDKQSNLLSECESKNSNDIVNAFHIECREPRNVFSTASGQRINVNKDSIDKAIRLFINCESPLVDGECLLPSNLNHGLKGKVNALLADHKTCNATGNIDVSKISMNAFSTASGKSIIVNSDSLEQAKRLFTSCECDNIDDQASLNAEHFSEYPLNIVTTGTYKRNNSCYYTEHKTNQRFKSCKPASVIKNNVQCEEIANSSKYVPKYVVNNLSTDEITDSSGTGLNQEVLKKAKQLFLSENSDELDKYLTMEFVTEEKYNLFTPVNFEDLPADNPESKYITRCEFDGTYCKNVKNSSTNMELNYHNLVNYSGRNIKDQKSIVPCIEEKPINISYDMQKNRIKNTLLVSNKNLEMRTELNSSCILGDSKPSVNNNSVYTGIIISDNCDTNNSSFDRINITEENNNSGKQSPIIFNKTAVYNHPIVLHRKENKLLKSNKLLRSFNKCSYSLTQEIIESKAAFAADEESNHSDDLFDLNDDTYLYHTFFDCHQLVSNVNVSRSPSPIFGCSSEFIMKRKQGIKTNDLLYSKKENGVMNLSSPVLCGNKKKRLIQKEQCSLERLKRFKCEDFYLTEDIIAKRIEATGKQLELIKLKTGIKPLKGSHFLKRAKGMCMPLKELGIPRNHSEEVLLKYSVKPHVIHVNSKNATDFIFPAQLYYSKEICNTNTEGITVGDNVRLILSPSNTIGLSEISSAFLSSPGVDPNLISEKWIRNHYRWIVWKLASMEKKFPKLFANKYLTPNNVAIELKYRYDREIDNCERSCLKRILECDDSPNKKMVLCVADIVKVPESIAEYELELTDGWYSVMTCIDMEMNRLVHNGIVNVGCKLAICNATLVGCNEGCDPLEITSNVRLKIATNSSARVPWYTRLGYSMPVCRIQRTLYTVLPNGGMIGELSAFVARVYPLLYLRRWNDGKSVICSERTIRKQMVEYDKERQVVLEKIYSQVKQEMKSTLAYDMEFNSENCSANKCQENSTLFELLSYDTRFDTEVIHKGKKLNNSYFPKQNELIRDIVLQKLPAEYKMDFNAIPILKIRLADDGRKGAAKSAILTIWRPAEDVISLLSEGSYFTFFNVTSNGIRNGELQLCSTRQTIYKLNEKTNKFKRTALKIEDFLDNRFSPPFGEVDIIGIIINVKLEVLRNVTLSRHQTIALGDQRGNIIAVTFRNSVTESGYEDILKPGSVIACVNLHWRCGYIADKIPVTFVDEFSLLSCNPRRSDLAAGMEEHNMYVKTIGTKKLLSEYECKLSLLLNVSRTLAISTPVNKRSNEESNDTIRNSTTPNLSHHSGMMNNSDPISDTMKKNTKSRLQKLQLYGEPPPLSPIVLNPPKQSVFHSSKHLKSNSTHE